MREATAESSAGIHVLDDVRHNVTFLILDLSVFSCAIVLIAENTVLPAFLSSLTSNPIAFGALAASFALGRSLPQLLGATLISGRSKRRPLLIAVAGLERLGILSIAIAASLVGSAAPSVLVPLFILAAGLYAATTGLFGPIYGDYVAAALPRNRGAFYGVAQLIGGLIGFGAAQVAARLLERQPGPAGLQVLFWAAFGLSLVSLAFMTQLRDVPVGTVSRRETFREVVTSVPGVLRGHSLFSSYLIGRLACAAGLMGGGLIVADAAQRGLGQPSIAQFAGALVLAQSLSAVALGLVGDRWGFTMVALIGGLATVGSMACAIAGGAVPGAYVASFALLGTAIAAPLISDPNVSMTLAPPGHVGRFLAITATAVTPALVLAPLAGAAIASVVSYQATFVAAIGCAATGIAVLAARHPPAVDDHIANLE